MRDGGVASALISFSYIEMRKDSSARVKIYHRDWLHLRQLIFKQIPVQTLSNHSVGRATSPLPRLELRSISTLDQPEPAVHEEESEQDSSFVTDQLVMRDKLIRHQLEARRTAAPEHINSTLIPALSGPDWIQRDQIKALLEICACELCNLFADNLVNAKMSALLKLVGAGSGQTIRYKEWAGLSLALEQLLARLTPLHTNRMSRAEFLRQNLVNLEKTCRYAWARDARAALVQIFTEDNVSVSVINPTLQDITLRKASVEVGTPPPFLTGTLELGYQTMKYINDEGYIMRTRTGTVSLTGKASAHVGVGVSGKGKVMAGTGPLAYCRNALDDAKYFFNEILDENSDVPRLAPYLSRAGAVGSGSADKIEIRDFEAIQNDFLIQQERIAQYFSLLLSTPVTLQTQRHGPIERPAYRHWHVHLKATAEKQARALKGSVSTVSGSAGGLLSFGLGQAELTGEKLKKTTCAKRTRTLCELLKDPNLAPKVKAELINKLGKSCRPIWQSVSLKFWRQDALDQGRRSNTKIIANLRQDLKSYTRAQAWLAQGHPGAAAMLTQYHERYCASNSAAMLGNMALLIADSYVKVLQQETGATQKQLTAQLIELEHELFHCGIPGARQILEKQAFARQQYRYAQNEKNVQVTVGAGILGGAYAQTVKYSRWSLNHYESFAAGDYEKIDFTLGLSQEVKRQVLQSVSDYVKANIPGVSAVFGAGSYSKQGSYSVRYFRPNAFANQPFSKQYERIVVQENLQLGVNVPLPVPLPVSIQVAASYSRATTTMQSETPGSDSLCYFARHYMHARQTKKTDENGKIIQDSSWYWLERKHRAVFHHMFMNYAATRHTHGRLVDELDAIDQGLPMDPAGRATCLIARNRFLDCTEQLRIQPNSAENYEACLKALKALLDAWFPYWLKRREDSPIYGAWRVGLLH